FEEQQRIYTDGRGFPEDLENTPMGYSIGRWEGSTLVVETRGLSEAVWDSRGMPISDEARVIQRLYLDESGNLHNEITLHDPRYYNRPVLRHAYWTYDPDAGHQEYDCDPHSFYRTLDIEGRLDEYWGRSRTRRGPRSAARSASAAADVSRAPRTRRTRAALRYKTASRADAVIPAQRFDDEVHERADLRAHEPPRRVQHPELGSPVRHGAPDHEAALGRRVRDDATRQQRGARAGTHRVAHHQERRET